jgi:hypothetical protein
MADDGVKKAQSCCKVDASMSDSTSKKLVAKSAAKEQSDAITAGLAWLHGSVVCSGVFITPNRLLCPRCVCSSWRAASSLVIKRHHPTDNTVLSITCDPSDCFLANNILDIVIIGVSPVFAEAAAVRPVPISWPEASAASLTIRSTSGADPALGSGYRLYRLVLQSRARNMLVHTRRHQLHWKR